MDHVMKSTLRHGRTVTALFAWPMFLLRRLIYSTPVRSIRQEMAFESLSFDNLALRRLPVETNRAPGSRQVPGACFSRVSPSPVTAPRLVAASAPAFRLLGLDPAQAERAVAPEILCGNRLLPGTQPAAHCYCGHQFGNFAGQLGDGAAMYLGEVLGPQDDRWELQLKGAGPTPYSRQSDGRKVLRSSLREFLCSEAMHHLGIPTTRAASCTTSDTRVLRDPFYDGNSQMENCTVVLRIAPTFLRFGSFEIFKATDPVTGRCGPSVGLGDLKATMLDYTIQTFYPDIYAKYKHQCTEMYAEFFGEVVRSTARLVADWQCVGFCHGVLNTDNMSILGITIDYGPFGFMDRFDPNFVCNSSDDGGRYAYSQQPEICRWNLARLAEALAPELPSERSGPLLNDYQSEFDARFSENMRRKLGLQHLELPGDSDLVSSLLETMHSTGGDFTNCFRLLSQFSLSETEGAFDLPNFLFLLLDNCASLAEMQEAFRARMHPSQLRLMMSLAESNPMLLTHLGGQARLEAELERAKKLLAMQNMSESGKKERDTEMWTAWLQAYRERLKKDFEVSGVALEEWNASRTKIMNSANPKYILRNYIAQRAIDAAENGNFTEVRRVMLLLEQPYTDQPEKEEQLARAGGSLPRGAMAMSEQEEDTDEAGTSGRDKVGGYACRPPVGARSLTVT
uniref:protein adenylyltransferase SelO, mitochondrial n=1 Tax=Myxine glutinosa TaxID=7769 RepID=UPI00358FB6D1